MMTMTMMVQGRVEELLEEQSQWRVTAATSLKKQTAVFYLVPHGSHCPAISARCRRSLGKSDTKGRSEHGIKDGRENLVLK